MRNVKSIRETSLSPQQHIEAAEENIALAEDRGNDASWALVEAELATAHILAAFAKMGMEFMGGKKPAVPGLGALGLVAKLAR